MNPLMTAYAYLAVAIVCEVVGTSFMQKSEQFTKLVPALLTGAFYIAAFYLMSQSLRVLPLGITYAIWAGVGIVLTAVIGVVVFRQALDMAAILGIAMIVGGVVVMNVFSQSVSH